MTDRIIQLFENLNEGITRTIDIGNILLFAGNHTNGNFYIIITDRQTRNPLPFYKSSHAAPIANLMNTIENIPLGNSYWAPSKVRIEELINIEELKKMI
jgi:hypothetical protein